MPLVQVHFVKAHQSVGCLAFPPHNQSMVTGGFDRGNIGNTLKLWETQSWKVLHRLKGHKGRISAVSYAPNGESFCSAGIDGTLRLWSAITGEQLWVARAHHGVVFSIAVAPDGRTIASGGKDGALVIWDHASGVEVRRNFCGVSVLSVNFSADGSTLVAAVGRERQMSAVQLYSMPSGRLLQACEGHSDWPLWADFSPDGGILASGSYGELLLRDLDSGSVTSVLKPENSSLVTCDFSPDGGVIAGGGWDHEVERQAVPGGWNDVQRGRVLAWNVKTGMLIGSACLPDSVVRAIVFAPFLRLLASAGSDGSVRFWQVSEAE